MRQWEFLKNAFEAGRVAHAYLLSGPQEAGVKNFTKDFTKSIYCAANKRPCLECQNCRLIEQGNFPDVTVVKSSQSKSSIENEKDMMEIVIEQIRQVQNFLALTPYYGTWKIVIIEDADRMTEDAQHCFLKSLEEPKGHAIIFLQTSHSDMLLPTILSRCQELRFFHRGLYEVSPQEEEKFRGLRQAIGSILAQKFAYAKNANLEREHFDEALYFLRKHFRAIFLKDVAHIETRQRLELIEKIARQSMTSNINYKLALEVLLLEL